MTVKEKSQGLQPRTFGSSMASAPTRFSTLRGRSDRSPARGASRLTRHQTGTTQTAAEAISEEEEEESDDDPFSDEESRDSKQVPSKMRQGADEEVWGRVKKISVPGKLKEEARKESEVKTRMAEV